MRFSSSPRETIPLSAAPAIELVNDRHCRRWLLLLFSTLAAGATAQNASDLARALDCYHARRYTEARTLFVELARERPADLEIEFYLGRLALWFDDEVNALVHLERACRVAPDDARVVNALGDAYGLAAQNAPLLAKLGWARKCLAAYTRAVELEPRNLAFRWSLLGYYCVAPRLAGGGAEKALVQANEIAKLDAMSGRIARSTLALADERFNDAFAEFEAVLQGEPDNFLALYHVGRCAALSKRNIDRGIAVLRRCLELRPPEGDGQPTHACVYHRLGNLHESKGDRTTAEALYATARRLHPDFRAHKIALKN
jgi:tetratricopeptide (TPR) repeat protein